MFLTSQHIHKGYFQISFFKGKVSQPGKLKNLVHLSGPVPMLFTSTPYAAWRMEYVSHFAFKQILTIGGEAFCWYKTQHPTLLGLWNQYHTFCNCTLPWSYRSSTSSPEQYTMQMSCISFWDYYLQVVHRKKQKCFFFSWLFTLRGHAEQ